MEIYQVRHQLEKWEPHPEHVSGNAFSPKSDCPLKTNSHPIVHAVSLVPALWPKHARSWLTKNPSTIRKEQILQFQHLKSQNMLAN